MKKCKLCNNNTTTIFNIDFKAIHICESCANSIFLQQATWLANKNNKQIHVSSIISEFCNKITKQKD